LFKAPAITQVRKRPLPTTTHCLLPACCSHATYADGSNSTQR
jgi:hypothetical protein